MSSGACGSMRYNARNLTNLFDSEFILLNQKLKESL